MQATQEELKSYLAFAESVAQKATPIFTRYYENDAGTQYKDNNSPVTLADKSINSLVIEEIKSKYPDHDVLGEEESSLENDSDWVWICDPIDGTNVFTWRLPYACIMLALAHKGDVLVSVIYDVGSDRMYTATKGGGAYCNNQPISVNTSTDISKLVVECSGSTSKYVNPGEMKKNVELTCHRLAVLMCVAQGNIIVANGGIGGHIFAGQTAHDMAAPSLLISEAGGKVTDLFGNKQDFSQEVKGMVCSNGLIHNEMLEIVRKSLLPDVARS
jgi:myo-inositol-1(or 4)-monophosphatase